MSRLKTFNPIGDRDELLAISEEENLASRFFSGL